MFLTMPSDLVMRARSLKTTLRQEKLVLSRCCDFCTMLQDSYSNYPIPSLPR